MVRNYVKKPKNQCDDKEIQDGLHRIKNGASIQVELGLSIVEIYVDQHSKRFLFLSFNEFVFMLFDHWLYFLVCF